MIQNEQFFQLLVLLIGLFFSYTHHTSELPSLSEITNTSEKSGSSSRLVYPSQPKIFSQWPNQKIIVVSSYVFSIQEENIHALDMPGSAKVQCTSVFKLGPSQPSPWPCHLMATQLINDGPSFLFPFLLVSAPVPASSLQALSPSGNRLHQHHPSFPFPFLSALKSDPVPGLCT